MWESSTTPEILFRPSIVTAVGGFFYFAVLAAHFAPCCAARSVEYSRTLPRCADCKTQTASTIIRKIAAIARFNKGRAAIVPNTEADGRAACSGEILFRPSIVTAVEGFFILRFSCIISSLAALCSLGRVRGYTPSLCSLQNTTCWHDNPQNIV